MKLCIGEAITMTNGEGVHKVSRNNKIEKRD